MKMRNCMLGALAASVALAGAAATALAAEDEKAEQWGELPLVVQQRTIEKVFAMPAIETAAGFSWSVLVSTRRELFDPFDMFIADDHTLWVADDAKSGAIWKVTLDGQVAPLALPKQHSPISLDMAPKSFGPYAGQLYTVAFAKPEKAGGWELPDAITRIDPATGRDTLICYLPESDSHEPGAGGFFARFGPEGSPFGGRLWVTAASNHTIYQVTPDGKCKPWVTIDLQKWGSPRAIAFTPDGRTMLLGVAAPMPENRNKTRPDGGRILKLAPDGTVAGELLAGGLHEPGVMAYAPKGFGAYGGQIFITDAGEWDNDVEATEPIPSDGKVYRIDADGRLVLVASGFRNPVGVAFIAGMLVISDINGDYHIGNQKFPDGFIVTLKLK